MVTAEDLVRAINGIAIIGEKVLAAINDHKIKVISEMQAESQQVIAALHALSNNQDTPPDIKQLLTQVLTTVTQNQQLLKEIKMTDAQVLDVLNQVDVTTTKIATNLDTVAAAQASEASVVQSISDEIDALVANQGSNGISDATAQKLQDIANRLQTSSDNSDKVTAAINAQVPVLTAIAAKGQPTVPQPPPPPTI